MNSGTNNSSKKYNGYKISSPTNQKRIKIDESCLDNNLINMKISRKPSRSKRKMSVLGGLVSKPKDSFALANLEEKLKASTIMKNRRKSSLIYGAGIRAS